MSAFPVHSTSFLFRLLPARRHSMKSESLLFPVSPGTWSLWLSQVFVHSLWSLCYCHWCCLSSAWSSQHWSPCRRLWRLFQDAKLNLLVLLPLLLSHQCHQHSGGWWLFCLQCWQCLHDLLRRLSWSYPEICWRGWVRVDIPVRLQLLFGTSLHAVGCGGFVKMLN